jgi:4'-phosphopantetheinyl transferase
MSLASQLLKHYVVAKGLGIPWSSTTLTRDANKKPVYLTPSGEEPVYFNVSHQAGIVTLVAVTGYAKGPVEAGVDVVCVSEREKRDHQMIKDEGWHRFVDVHSDVFGRSESGYLKNDLLLSGRSALPARPTPDEVTDFKLRNFYALWCLREAYVKMTGEALLAPWLKDLEFHRFQAPKPAVLFEQGVGDAAETITQHEVLFKGAKVDDANICLRSLGKDYMTCTAIRTPSNKEDGLGWELGPFEFISLDSILEFADAE